MTTRSGLGMTCVFLAIVALAANAAPGDGCPGEGGNCCEANGTPGCDDAACCELICGADAFCCNTAWDGICASAAQAMCAVCDGGGDPVGACCLGDDGCLEGVTALVCAKSEGKFLEGATCADCGPGSNDFCENATPIGVPSLTAGSTLRATQDEFPFCGTSITAPGVWYRVTGTGTTITATTCENQSPPGGADYDTKINVYCGGCDKPICVAGNDDEPGCNFHSTVSWCAQAGSEYLILVQGFGGATGTFTLSVFDDGIPCAPAVECPGGVTGACCFGDECADGQTEADCTAGGGDYQGDGSTCANGVAGTAYEPGFCDSDFEDISGSGIEAPTASNVDDGGDVVPLGFSFEFYGVAHTEIAVCSNGYLTFGTNLGDFTNNPIPAGDETNDVIAPLWDDWSPNQSGTVHYQTLGSAPDRRFVAQWTDVPHFSGSGTSTFQAVLYEGSNCIEFRYGSPLNIDSPTIGIENADGTDGLDLTANDIFAGACLEICPEGSGGGFVECEPAAGACCYLGDCLDEQTQGDCVDLGGDYQGNGTSCEPGLCPPIKGACCFDNGQCATVEQKECAAAAGDYQGDDTVCAPGACAAPVGACCFADGSCQELTQSACLDLAGTFQGGGSVCRAGLCPSPPGACCVEGECLDGLFQEECDAQGGDYQGDGTVCFEDLCPPIKGACCFDNGQCAAVELEECLAGGGVYQGDNTVCEPGTCPPPIGACCLDGGGCAELTQADCLAGGGVFQGAGTTCVPGLCPEIPTGACCLGGTATCLVLTEDECAAGGGEYQGDETVCVPDPCGPPPTGACCFDGTECVDGLTQDDCEGQGGAYAGDFSECIVIEGGFVLGVDDTSSEDSQLFALDLVTGELTLIGPAHENLDLEGLARFEKIIVGGAGDEDGPHDLVEVDFETGDVFDLAGLDLDDEIIDMTSAKGVIWAFIAGEGFAIVELDGTVDLVIESDIDFHGIAITPDGTTLFGITLDGDIYEIDVASGDIDELVEIDDLIDLEDEDIENLEMLSATELAFFIHQELDDGDDDDDGGDVVLVIFDIETGELTTIVFDVDLEDIEDFVPGGGVFCPDIPETGACCLQLEGQAGVPCEIVTEAECEKLGGDYQGDGTSCEACVPAVGACCFLFEGKQGFCEILPEGLCQKSEGEYQGDGTDCEVCFQPQGACCLVPGAEGGKGGGCAFTTAEQCAELGGDYLGDGSECFECFGCGDAEGNCFQPNGTPGCDQEECCGSVCTQDPFCCEVEWDQTCADQAADICKGGGSPCPGDGDCFEANGTPGCDDEACCELICGLDPDCCDVEWDASCALDAEKECSVGSECPGSGSCFQSNGSPGCDDVACCEAVCAFDPFCCEVDWDENCAAEAQCECGGCPADTNCDGVVNVTDLVNVVLGWGCEGPGCTGDVNGDGLVNVDDLIAVVLAWGPCPD